MLLKRKQAKVGHTVLTARGLDGLKHRTWGQTVGKMVSLRRSRQGSAVTLTPHSELDPDYIFSSERYKLLDRMALLSPFLFLTFFFVG